ncbi:hypothetical protein [Schaedlerella arabinosiphila]|uniref:hypothetical protein n=1 Tax=Schaedlerella arabinosiphila TaxID=2044587 RepID=UPI00255813D7|nr:hypothetical protein [Schaedlerella arabinosiphila]
MNKLKTTYDTRNAKKAVLINFWSAYGQICRADGIDTSLEEEIMFNKLFTVLDEDTGSREQYEELLAIAYMFQGIGESLRARHKTGEIKEGLDEIELERKKFNENAFSFFSNKEYPF